MSGPEQTDDATLSAYLDGELPRDEADRVTERLSADPGLRRRLDELRGADVMVRRAYEEIDEQPLPQSVLDLLQESAADRSRDASGVHHVGNGEVKRRKPAAQYIVPFPARVAQRIWQAPVAIAASIALVVGFTLGGLNREASGPASELSGLYAGRVPAGSELHRLLDTASSGEAQILADGAEGQVLLTFENESGQFCRQLGLRAETGSMQGLACRRGDAWRMVTATFDAAAAPDGQYGMASASSPVLDAAIDAQIGTNEPLDPEQEKRLISNNWKKFAE